MQNRITRILEIQPGVSVVVVSRPDAEASTGQLNNCIIAPYKISWMQPRSNDCKKRRRASRRLLIFPNTWGNKIGLSTGV